MAQITTAELAAEIGTTPREVRKFLRSDESPIEPVGKGSRYSIEKRQVAQLRKKYAKWDEARKADSEDNSDEVPESDN